MRKLLAVLTVGMVALVGCSPSVPESTAATAAPTTASPSPTPPPTTEPPPPPPVWPLTGVLMEDPTLEGKNPVVGIKVENSGAARPWVGLAAADIVFVEMVEAGMTRFHAVYNSYFPEVVGPVRSVRPMDAAILGQWEGTLLASGGQPQFLNRVESVVGLMTQDRGNAGFYRDRSRRAPHNVFVEMATVLPKLSAPSAIPPIAEYGPAHSTIGGDPGTLLKVNYPAVTSSWEYDAASKTYLRNDNQRASVEADGTRVAATNVLVLKVTTKTTGALDPVGNPVPETVLSGTGTMYVFIGGNMITGTWSKGADNDPFVLTDADGAPLVLAPGITWIELLPERGVVSWDPPPASPSPSAPAGGTTNP